MQVALYFVIIAMTFSSGKAINCFYCIEGTPNYSSNSFSQIMRPEYMNKSPTEHCKTRGGVIVGPTCIAPTTCAKVNMYIDKHDPIVVRSCSPIDVSDKDLPAAHGKIESRGVTLTTYACNENLCNDASSTVKILSFKFMIPLIALLLV